MGTLHEIKFIFHGIFHRFDLHCIFAVFTSELCCEPEANASDLQQIYEDMCLGRYYCL